MKVRNPIGRPPVRRSDIAPLTFLVFFFLFASGFFQITVYGYTHPQKKLTFWENYFAPTLYWPGLTILTYGGILAWRSRWLENVIVACKLDWQKMKEESKRKRDSKNVRIITSKDDTGYIDPDTAKMINDYEREKKRWRMIFAVAMTTLTVVMIPLLYYFMFIFKYP